MQIFNQLIGMVHEQVQLRSPKASFMYLGAPMTSASARYGPLSAKTTNGAAPFQRLEARSERKKNTLTTDAKSPAHPVNGCTGCHEILKSKQQRIEAKGLLSLQRAVGIDELNFSRGFQQL